MPPHSHRDDICIEPCLACEEKHLYHTETNKEKQSKPKKQPPPIAVLWCAVKRCLHIKREKGYKKNRVREDKIFSCFGFCTINHNKQ